MVGLLSKKPVKCWRLRFSLRTLLTCWVVGTILIFLVGRHLYLVVDNANARQALIAAGIHPIFQQADPFGPNRFWFWMFASEESWQPSVREYFSKRNFELHPTQYPNWLRKYFSVTYWDIVDLEMEDEIDDSDLELLSGATFIRGINFGWSPVSDDDISRLARNNSIRSLFLDGTQVTDEGLENLTQLTRLEVLSLSFTEVSDEGLRHLAKVTNLKHLNLFETRVSDDGISEMQHALPTCEIER